MEHYHGRSLYIYIYIYIYIYPSLSYTENIAIVFVNVIIVKYYYNNSIMKVPLYLKSVNV